MGFRAFLGWSGLQRGYYVRARAIDDKICLVPKRCHCEVDRVAFTGVRRWGVVDGRQGVFQSSPVQRVDQLQARFVRLLQSCLKQPLAFGRYSIPIGSIGVVSDLRRGIRCALRRTKLGTNNLIWMIVKEHHCALRFPFPPSELGDFKGTSLRLNDFYLSPRKGHLYMSRVLTWAETILLVRAIVKRFCAEHPEVECNV